MNKKPSCRYDSRTASHQTVPVSSK